MDEPQRIPTTENYAAKISKMPCYVGKTGQGAEEPSLALPLSVQRKRGAENENP